MSVTNRQSNRIWWIVGCLAALLIAGVICCVATVVAGGSVITLLAPQVQSTLAMMTVEAQQPALRVTDLAPALPPPPGPSPTPPAVTNFTNNKGRSEYPAAAVDAQGNLHVIWFDNSLRGGDASQWDILHRQLSADGQWADVDNLSDGFEMLMENSARLLTAPDGRMCIYWMGSQSYEVGSSAYLRCWSNGQWGEVEKLELSAEMGVYESSPAFTPDGKLEIAFSSMGEWRLHDQRIIPSPDYVYGLKFLIDSKGVYHLLWYQNEPSALWHRSSQDQGQTWQDAAQVSTKEGETPYSSSNIQAISDNLGNLHVIWTGQDGAHYRLWQADGGWQASEKVLANQQFMGDVILAADAQGLPHLAYTMIANGPPSIGTIHRQADGQWTSPMLVAFTGKDESINGSQLVLVIDAQGRQHFIWPVARFGAQGLDNSDLYFAVLP